MPDDIRRMSGDEYRAGPGFVLRNLVTIDQIRAAMATTVRRVTTGKLETEAGYKIVQMLERILRAAHMKRQHELDARRLDLLGAAAESGAAIFEGIAIVPPPQVIQGDAPATLTIEPPKDAA